MSTRKHDDNIGSFTENLSYNNEVNALSHPVKAAHRQDVDQIQDKDRSAQNQDQQVDKHPNSNFNVIGAQKKGDVVIHLKPN